MTTNRPAAAALAALLALAGCDGGAEKLHDVSGPATFNGKPIPAGIIYFDPDPTKGGTGPQGFATIKDGRYDTAAEGKGIRGGAYEIRVTGYDGKAANEAPMGQALFPEHVIRTELPARKQEFPIDVPKK